ncbi:MAG: gamma-glutamyl-gamma-aminobutyrate hydrolase family protein [Nitrospirae bacterium]|nr:gamma-glutamyl-gamma-aminobutyrate hydrolase family protein [Nitrospirota bacterium]
MKHLGIIGEYYPDFKPHIALNEALEHVRDRAGLDFDYEWIETERIKKESEELLKKFAGIWSAPGSPFKSLDGAIKAIKFARVNNIPHLGTCAGFQHTVVEFARNVLGFTNAQHEEYGPTSSQLFINRLACSLAGLRMKVRLQSGSLAARCYGANETEENYYCNFGINPEFKGNIMHPDLLVSGVDSDGEIRIIEISKNKFFLATLFVPQVNSTPDLPHPIIKSFVQASIKK